MSALPHKKAKFDPVSTLDPSAAHPPTFHTPSSHPSTSAARPENHGPARTKRKVPTHGNFYGYFTKRSRVAGGDERLGLVPREWVAGKRALDVGCNSGVVTVELAQGFGAGEAVGVDIDDGLVELAKKYTTLCWSRQAPLMGLIQAAEVAPTPSRDEPPHQKAQTTPPTPTATVIAAASATADPAPPPAPNYFPLAFPRCYGYLPQPPHELLVSQETVTASPGMDKSTQVGVEVRQFPANVTFKTADWAKDGIEEDRKAYDIIFAFSITKWIHLNTLNAGLLAFFTRLHRSLRPGGRLVLEPQPFASYKDSARLSDQLKANYEVLRDGDVDGVKGWKDEDGDFERVLLEQVGFERRERLGETGEKGFHRPVDVYYKRAGSWV